MNKNILPIMLKTVSNNLNLMFKKDSQINKEIRICNNPDFKDNYMAMISLANLDFQGQLVLGLSKKITDNILAEFMPLLPANADSEELIHSAIGELLNNCIASFTQDDEIINYFDNLSIGLPIIWGKSFSPYFSEADGYFGTIEIDNNCINVFLEIKAYPCIGDFNFDFDNPANVLSRANDLDALLNQL